MSEFTVPQSVIEIQPIREIICDHVRQAIIDGVIKPGDRIVEKDIALKFNVSRTPVREGLRKLETEGLIEYIARKGVVVRGFNAGEIEEIYTLRKVLECLASKMVIQKITPAHLDHLKQLAAKLSCLENEDETNLTYNRLMEFEDQLYAELDMPILLDFMHSLRVSLQRYRKINLSNDTRRKEAVSEHKEILQAIIAGNIELTEQLICAHIDNSKAELMRLIKKQNGNP
jgi:DNA-binding GntR family transcriptional regulator